MDISLTVRFIVALVAFILAMIDVVDTRGHAKTADGLAVLAGLFCLLWFPG